MTTEIELKYQLSTKHKDNSIIITEITTMLNDNNIFFEKNQSQLINRYYDNKQLALRKMDFGLRTRTKGDKHEQTIKTAGKVEAGLHQRPEYNVDLPKPQVNLSLFPASIWPNNVNLTTLQQSLHVIFSTNFLRHTWLIQQNDTVMELAFDSGEICTAPNRPSVIINEIEIELVKGNKAALFTLAEQLMKRISMEPSNLSKAARGYTLFHNEIAADKTSEN